MLFLMPVGCQLAQHFNKDQTHWWELRRDSSEQAPPVTPGDAVIQVYAARAARFYQRLEVIGYYAYYGGNTVRNRRGNPDGYWFGNRPTLLREITGNADVDELIDRLEAAASDYPYPTTYHVWPGPNSNTFVAWLARSVPELKLELPPHAIGKDYLPNGAIAAKTPSGRGGQISLGGYAGVMLGLEEGIEVNLLGLTLGLDWYPLALKLPAVGRQPTCHFLTSCINSMNDELFFKKREWPFCLENSGKLLKDTVTF